MVIAVKVVADIALTVITKKQIPFLKVKPKQNHLTLYNKRSTNQLTAIGTILDVFIEKLLLTN